METYQIKTIFNEVIFEIKCECLKHCVILAVENNVNLSNADLFNVDLRNVNLSYVNLFNADLRYANLRNADLSYTNLSIADLSYTNLSNADLSNANLYNANLYNANLYNANLRYNANLSHAKGIIYINYNNYNIYVQHNHTKIGCQYLTNEEWLNMSVNEAIKLGCKKEDFKEIKNICKNALEKLKKEK